MSRPGSALVWGFLVGLGAAWCVQAGLALATPAFATASCEYIPLGSAGAQYMAACGCAEKPPDILDVVRAARLRLELVKP